MITSRLREESAMTLIELLAVVTILGILSAIAAVSFGNLISVSKDQAFLANSHTMRDAARFRLMNYPVNILYEKNRFWRKLIITRRQKSCYFFLFI
ncbi:type IV pilin protein [Peribacillus sp. SCS-37]|uniref:type IV pilin protein n=1 Tax=Paraperibacillus esterisolvens TaxID=3115296 RepID=UPI003906ABD1